MVIVRECSRGGKHALIGPLADGSQYGSRRGSLQHSSIIGRHPRDRITTSTDHKFMVHHPTLGEYVLLCSRKCTPIYPKDASAIISMLDISPGDRILEAGTGNAGLTMYLARAVGVGGKVETVERDEKRSQHAQGIVAGFRVGSVADVVDGIAHEHDPLVVVNDKRANLILPALPMIYSYLKTDRYVVCYLPSMSQVMDLDIVEVDWRDWDVRLARVRNPGPEMADDEAMVCRPTHLPTGHTAFLVKLRKCASDLIASSIE
ncbi:adenine-N(1)--methyltransferase [Linderina pennispora]|uniref:tRNA (adenine(58)-N(1))-methyltransferase catalytic subunit TRM61 n=1 Tax=Linderina pennispora TaxID=61395 RepID=A0A1Y1WGN0_9FUNG|nr:adenine-N(1)--methyltransferase [Linderina pennispora]ORX72498.1 adenine-N(1)--methyltransferase [Linderina pennispora]